MEKKAFRVACPNGHLGYAPIKTGSFYRAVETQQLDLIAADSGSCDIGPEPLGSDTSCSPLEWQKHDLEHMLLASRKLGIPMMIGSAGDTGANSRVDLYVDIIKKLAEKYNLPKFKIGYFYSEVSKNYLAQKIEKGEVKGLDGRSNLTKEDLEKTDHIVAMADVHPYIKLLDMGADVIIGGRGCDCALFAAPAIRAGFPENLAYALGKAIECASFCAEPYGGKETIVGTITDTEILLTAMHPEQRCTPASVASHIMYERSSPYYEHVPSGILDMSEARYDQYDEKTCRITGSKFIPSKDYWFKLEGAGKVGERYIGIAAFRDPYLVRNIDRVIEWAKSQVRERYGDTGYELYYHVYGKNGVMGNLEPIKETRSHELCVIVVGVAPTKEMAYDVTMIGTRQMFYARLPEIKGTAGGAAFPVDVVLPAPPAYKWTINHAVRVDDPMELFSVHITEAGK